jgi:hypothetical protein
VSSRPTTALLGTALVGGAGTLLGLMASGKLTLDTGWGRSTHHLGPLAWTVDAPREMLWQQLTGPYLGAIPRDMRDNLSVLERSSDFVIASHRSDLGLYSAETVEAVGFSEPAQIRFRHLRGPVPYATEEFRLEVVDHSTTRLTYEGELGLDWWLAGRLTARHVVVPIWLNTVNSHVESSVAAVTKRAEARRRRASRSNRQTGEPINET